MAEPQVDHDRRATRRFALRLPVNVRYGANGDEETGQTRDVSVRGICFYIDTAIQAGSPIEFTLTLPPEITLTESIRVRCKGRATNLPNCLSTDLLIPQALANNAGSFPRFVARVAPHPAFSPFLPQPAQRIFWSLLARER